MKTIFTAAALATLSFAFVLPASAQTHDQSYWSGYRAGHTAASASLSQGQRMRQLRVDEHRARAEYGEWSRGSMMGVYAPGCSPFCD